MTTLKHEVEREAFEAHLSRMPTWAPEFEIHRGWVEMFAWDVWLARASHEANADAEDARRYRSLRWVQTADDLGPIFRADVRRTEKTLFNVGAAIDAAPSSHDGEDQ